jgi:hypothetical protein
MHMGRNDYCISRFGNVSDRKKECPLKWSCSVPEVINSSVAEVSGLLGSDVSGFRCCMKCL